MNIVLKLVAIGLLVSNVFIACQPMPRPFQPISKSIQDTPPALDAKIGIFVGGIDNASNFFEENFSRELVKALISQGIVASKDVANQSSYLLIGELISESETSPHLTWRMIAADGNIVGFFEQTGLIAEQNITKLAENTAARINSLFFADKASSEFAKISQLPSVFLPAVDGAPGDGRVSLTSAMRSALIKRAGRIHEDVDDINTLIVLGSIMVRTQSDGELIEVHWSVINNKGEELGSVDQNNVLPTGSLEGPWGNLAHVIADGGADGILTLLQAIQESVIHQSDNQ